MLVSICMVPYLLMQMACNRINIYLFTNCYVTTKHNVIVHLVIKLELLILMIYNFMMIEKVLANETDAEIKLS